jgi:DNA-binding HxlR family transcriptional regulator
LVLDNIFSGKIRIALLTKLLLNPASKVYLRGLERDLGVSSNTVRLELNKLQEMRLIEAQDDSENTKVKNYVVNQGHPMFKTLRGIIMQFVGLDQIVDQIIKKLGNLDQVYLTGDLAEGKNSPFVDLVLVGEVDKPYLYQLIEKAEPLIQKKIRVGIYHKAEFTESIINQLGIKMELLKLNGNTFNL